MQNLRKFLNIAVFCLILGVIGTAFIFLPDTDISTSERRKLMSHSQLFETIFPDEETKENAENVEKVDPVQEIESYLLDQFPLRDTFRSLKAFLYIDVFKKNDNNKIYKYDGTIVKIEDQLDEKQVAHASNIINRVIEKYLKNNNVYYSVIPDKHYYASKENGYPALDYEKLLEIFHSNVKGAQYIDITDKLSLSDYYTTDSHWTQEKITDVAQLLCDKMQLGVSLEPDGGWKQNTLSPFYGVYYGQSALSVSPDDIHYLTSDDTEKMIMTVIDDMGKPQKKDVYTLENFKNIDPYDIFTDGAKAFITIENPNAATDKELVVFRDSFGSSIAPLFAQGYKTVTLVDLRYMYPDHVGMYMDMYADGFENKDVLFLYSTGLINAGGVIRDFMQK